MTVVDMILLGNIVFWSVIFVGSMIHGIKGEIEYQKHMNEIEYEKLIKFIDHGKEEK